MDIIDIVLFLINWAQSLIGYLIGLCDPPKIQEPISVDIKKYQSFYLDSIQKGLRISYEKTTDTVSLPDNFQELIQDIDQGAIVVSGHFGYYLALPNLLDQYSENKINVIAQKPLMKYAMQYCNSIRKNSSLEIVLQKDSYNTLEERLGQGQSTVLFIDNPTKRPSTENHQFLGTNYDYPSGATRLNASTGRPIWMVFLYQANTICLTAQKVSSVSDFYPELDRLVRRYPEQYTLWYYVNNTLRSTA